MNKEVKVKIITALVLVTITALAIFSISKALGLSTTPISNKVQRSGVILQENTEASWFQWTNGNLYYVITNRNMSGTSLEMQVWSFDPNTNTQSHISTFGSGYGGQDVIVENGTLYVYATEFLMDFNHKGNKIVKFTTTDLTNFSSAAIIKTMPSDTQVYNVSIAKNSSNEFILAYEFKKTGNTHFAVKFYKTTDLTNFTDAGGVIGGNWQVSCPELIFNNGNYYLYVATNPPSEPVWNGSSWSFFTIYAAYLGKSADLNTWGFSTAYTLYPEAGHSNDSENFHVGSLSVKNNTDFDLIEYNGKVYISYMIGDQATVAYMTYATYNGTLDQLFSIYYK